MSTTKILIEIKTNGLGESKFDETLERAALRFADCFTSAGGNVELCKAVVLRSDAMESVGLVVPTNLPEQPVEDAV